MIQIVYNHKLLSFFLHPISPHSVALNTLLGISESQLPYLENEKFNTYFAGFRMIKCYVIFEAPSRILEHIRASTYIFLLLF